MGFVRIQIEPVWRFSREGGPESIPVILDLLDGIRQTGKISRAADRANLSYRHAWNLIAKWSAFFEVPLVERKQGSGTRLTLFGARLVSAGQRLQTRLGPQLQSCSQEFETEINQFLPNAQAVIRVHAGEGFAVSKLKEILGSDVDLRLVGGRDSLISLEKDACDLAGMRLPQGPLRDQNLAAIRSSLSSGTHRVVSFVTRDMGLMVQRGNPFGIVSVRRLLDPSIRFVNRDPDSRTRLIFDQLLAREGMGGASIQGYEHVELTHAAVAACVASGMADVCFGVEAAARQFDLDFVRLVTEDCFFVCKKQFLEQNAMRRLIAVTRGAEFQAAISKLPGYKLTGAGAVRTVKEVFANLAGDGIPRRASPAARG